MQLGAIEVLPVIDGFIVSSRPATAPLPLPGSHAWLDQGGAFRPDGMRESTLGAFLVRTADRLVVVDLGGGPAHPGGYLPPSIDPENPSDPIANHFRQRKGWSDAEIRQFAESLARTELSQGELPSSLAKLNVRPEDVTDVVFTHLHFDHIGWISVDGRPCFPNATVHCASADLDHFMPVPDEDVVQKMLFQCPLTRRYALTPVLDRLHTWDSDGPLLPGIDVRLAPGHTPGSSVVMLSSGNDRAMLLGDVVHCPLELMDDDFHLLGDHDQALANKVREAYTRELEGSDVHVAGAHFPGLRFGRLLAGTGIRRFVFDQAG